VEEIAALPHDKVCEAAAIDPFAHNTPGDATHENDALAEVPEAPTF